MLTIVVYLVSEALPPGVIALVGIVFLPILGITKSLQEAAGALGNQLFFYTLACFAIGTVMAKMPISNRILYFFLKTFNKSTKGTITAIMLTTATISTYIKLPGSYFNEYNMQAISINDRR